mgnify:CR=1 FL=1
MACEKCNSMTKSVMWLTVGVAYPDKVIPGSNVHLDIYYHIEKSDWTNGEVCVYDGTNLLGSSGEFPLNITQNRVSGVDFMMPERNVNINVSLRAGFILWDCQDWANFTIEAAKFKCISANNCQYAIDGTFVSKTECQTTCTATPKWKCVDPINSKCALMIGGTYDEQSVCEQASTCKPSNGGNGGNGGVCKGTILCDIPDTYVYIGGALILMMMMKK